MVLEGASMVAIATMSDTRDQELLPTLPYLPSPVLSGGGFEAVGLGAEPPRAALAAGRHDSANAAGVM